MKRSRAIRVGVGAAAVASLAAVSSCASPPAAGGPPAQLAVEVLGGLPSVPEWLPATPPRVEVVLDATPSMRHTRVEGVSGFEAARALAARTLRELPLGTRASFHLVGGPERSDACGEASRALISEGGFPDTLADDARRAQSRGEASLGDALQRLGDDLDAAGETARARIVVVSDLAPDCGGDLCAAAARLVSGGASLDWVLVGDAPAPSCLDTIGAGPGPPGPIAQQPYAAPANISVTPRNAMLAGGEEALRARQYGVADGIPITVPAGLAFVGVDLVPPASFGPVALEPGRRHRLRVVDFPAASPPAREWQIDSLGSVAAPSSEGAE